MVEKLKWIVNIIQFLNNYITNLNTNCLFIPIMVKPINDDWQFICSIIIH